MSGSGGKGASGASKRYNKYGSILAVWHCGQSDKLKGLVIDDKLVWSGALLRSTSPNPVDITIEGRGIYRHWWGTRDEDAIDPLLQASGNNLGMSLSIGRGFTRGLFVDFLWGLERDQVPSARMIGERAPVQSLITGTPTALVDSQANPFVVLAELLTDQWFGLGMSTDRFSASKWQAAAELAEPKAALVYVSPMITSATAVRAVAAELFALCDGFLRAEAGTGLCEAGMFTAPEEIDVESLLVLGRASRVTLPKTKPETWDQVKTTWNVRFRDRDYDFKTRTIPHTEDAALDHTEEDRPEDLDRSNTIVRAQQALSHACEWGRRFSSPGLTGTGPFRGPLVENLRPGEHAVIDVQPEPAGAVDERICRILEVKRGRSDEAKVKFEAVRSVAPVFYPTVTPAEAPAPAEIPCVTHARIFALPAAFDGTANEIGVLAARPASDVTELAVLFSETEEGQYSLLGQDRSFAVRGRLSGNLLAGSNAAVDVELLDELDREIFDTSPGATAAANDEVLMILFHIVDDQIDLLGNRSYFEIFSCSDFSSSAPDSVTVEYLRGRRGTTRKQFVDHDEVWFIRRSNLPVFAHAAFATLSASQSTGYFDLQPGTSSDRKTGCDVWPFVFPPQLFEGPKYSDLITIASPMVACYHREVSGTAARYGYGPYNEEPTSSTLPRLFRRLENTGGIFSQYMGVWPGCGNPNSAFDINYLSTGWKQIDAATLAVTESSPIRQFATENCSSSIVFSETQKVITGSGVCCGAGAPGDYRINSGVAYETASDPDLWEDAINRLLATLDDIETLDWELCVFAPDNLCGHSIWTTPTGTELVTGFPQPFNETLYKQEFQYGRGQFRVVFSALDSPLRTICEVPIYRAPAGGGDYELYETRKYTFDGEDAAAGDFYLDLPEQQDYQFRCGIPTFKVIG